MKKLKKRKIIVEKFSLEEIKNIFYKLSSKDNEKVQREFQAIHNTTMIIAQNEGTTHRILSFGLDYDINFIPQDHTKQGFCVDSPLRTESYIEMRKLFKHDLSFRELEKIANDLLDYMRGLTVFIGKRLDVVRLPFSNTSPSTQPSSPNGSL